MNSDSSNYNWPKQNFDTWLEQIKKENPNLDTVHADLKIDDFIAVKAFPFISRSPIQGTIYTNNLSHRSWKCGISILIENPKKDNSFLLHALENGANFVLFYCPPHLNNATLSSLLKDVQLELITSHWKVQDEDSLQLLKKYLSNHYQNSEFFISQLDCVNLQASGSLSISLPIYTTNTWANELVQLINSLSKINFEVDKTIFTINLCHDFILNIASVRALKLIMLKLELLFQIKLNPYYELTIDLKNLSNSIHTNLISLSSMALAASLASPDVIILPAADQTHELKNIKWQRSSVHLMQLLQHESFLNRAIDPLAGSYCIEDLTEQIANQLWISIQTSVPYD